MRNADKSIPPKACELQGPVTMTRDAALEPPLVFQDPWSRTELLVEILYLVNGQK